MSACLTSGHQKLQRDMEPRNGFQGRIQPVGLTVFQNLKIQKWYGTTATPLIDYMYVHN